MDSRKIGLSADRIRVEQGMTIHEFCQKSGMGLVAATSFFSGKGLMRTDIMDKVAHALGVEVKILLLTKEEADILRGKRTVYKVIFKKYPEPFPWVNFDLKK